MTTLLDQVISLDPLQRAAAEAPEGPTMIIGGPGTGKTHTLLGRITALLKGGASPFNITYLTFSSRAAEDFRRLLATYPDTELPSRHIYVGTFHLYASTYLRQAGASALNISPHFTIWDREQAYDTLKELTANNPQKLDLKQLDLGKFLRWYSYNQARRPQDALPAEHSTWHTLLEIYTSEKRQQNTVDLDDLIPLAIIAMESAPNTRALWSRIRSKHLMVDEFQDITAAQYHLLELMTGPSRSITIATDPNQNIYTWRGSDITLLENFRMTHQSATINLLTINHRSTKTLTEAATALTDHDSMTGLHHAYQTPIRPHGPNPTLLDFKNTVHEMDQHIVNMILAMHKQGTPWEDIAVIYRGHTTKDRLITPLSANNIPLTILGDTKNQKYDDTRRITAMMACLLNPHDVNNFRIAAAAIQFINRQRLNPDVTSNINRVAKDTNTDLIQATSHYIRVTRPGSIVYKNLRYIITAWNELNNLLKDPEVSLYTLCKHAQQLLQDHRGHTISPVPEPQFAKLMAMTENLPRIPGETPHQHLARLMELIHTSPEPDHRSMDNDDPFAHHKGITLATIHAAKGLQWKVVFLVDSTDTIIPKSLKADNDTGIAEEQRLFYVAATRATDQLYFCSARMTGQGTEVPPSRFLAAFEHHLVQHHFPQEDN